MEEYEKRVREFYGKLLVAKTKEEVNKIYEEGLIALSKLTPSKRLASDDLIELWERVKAHLIALKWNQPDCSSCGRCSDT